MHKFNTRVAGMNHLKLFLLAKVIGLKRVARNSGNTKLFRRVFAIATVGAGAIVREIASGLLAQ